MFFWKLFERTLFKTLRHLQSFLVAFNEQVQNIEKFKASFVEVVSCFATVKERIQSRQSDVHIKPSSTSTKKTHRLTDGKDRGLFIVYVRSSLSVFVQVLCCTSG